MKKTGLFIVCIMLWAISKAGVDTTMHWDYASRITHGTTNEIMGITVDTSGAIYYSGYGYEIKPGNRHAFTVGKMNDTGYYIWKKEFFGYPDQPLHSLVTDGKSLFVAGAFRSHLHFPSDTLTSKSTSSYSSFLVSMDADNGEINWVKQFNQTEDIKLHLDVNGDIVLSVAALNGNQVYDQTTLTSLSIPIYQRGYGFMTISKVDGSIKNHAFGTNSQFPRTSMASIVDRKAYGLMLSSSSTWGPLELHLKVLDINTNSISGNKKTLFRSKNTYFDILNTVYLTNEKAWVVFVEHNNEDIYLENDTLYKEPINGQYKITSAVKLDSNLSYVKHIRFVSALENEFQVTNNNKILFTFGVEGDGFLNQDTILYKGIYTTHQRGYVVAKCNFDLDSFTYHRLSVEDGNAGWQTGMEVRGLYLANNGNHYTAVFHENDILMKPYHINAFNKSWKHLSVIGINGKPKNNDPTTSIKNVKKLEGVIVYPNPAKDIVQIYGKHEIKNIKVFNMEGKQLLQCLGKGNNMMKIDIRTLPKGLYFVSVETGFSIVHLKIEKL